MHLVVRRIQGWFFPVPMDREPINRDYSCPIPPDISNGIYRFLERYCSPAMTRRDSVRNRGNFSAFLPPISFHPVPVSFASRMISGPRVKRPATRFNFHRDGRSIRDSLINASREYTSLDSFVKVRRRVDKSRWIINAEQSMADSEGAWCAPAATNFEKGRGLIMNPANRIHPAPLNFSAAPPSTTLPPSFLMYERRIENFTGGFLAHRSSRHFSKQPARGTGSLMKAGRVYITESLQSGGKKRGETC